MLPMLATAAIGVLAKQSKAVGAASGGATGGGLGALAQLLDTDKDGDPMDDVLDVAKKFF